VLVNNAGIGAQGDVAANGDDEWRHVFDVNVLGIARCSAAALPHLRESEHAAIVNTSSVLAVLGVPGRALYSATKGAVLALTLAMAADHVREGIRVNAVAPGLIETAMLKESEARDKIIDLAMAESALKRVGQPEDLANLVAFLASDKAKHITGEIIKIDGGQYI